MGSRDSRLSLVGDALVAVALFTCIVDVVHPYPDQRCLSTGRLRLSAACDPGRLATDVRGHVRYNVVGKNEFKRITLSPCTCYFILYSCIR